MKQIILFFLFSIFTYTTTFAQFRSSLFSANGEYMTVEKSGSTTLENVYIFKTLSGATVSYTTNASNTVNIYTYETSFHDDKNLITISPTPIGTDRKMYTITNLQDYRGLAFEDNNVIKAVWVIDYSQHHPILNNITPVESDDKCEVLKLLIDKDDFLYFRETSGQQKEIKREYDIEYDILTWNDEEFTPQTNRLEKQVIGTEITLTEGNLPNTDTEFTLIGDQFGKEFGIPEKKTSNTYAASSVKAYITYKQYNRETDNEINEGGEGLGGSAPVEIDFYGHANEPTADHFSWYIYNKTDLKNPVARYNDQDINYTFEKYGDYIVQLEVANTSSGCVDTVSVSFNISESELLVPNFFSPRGTPGQNDVFKVSYKSIVKFKCTIFNRWGNKIYEWTDPSQGWDGRYKGKLVNPGVYYYVIEATGSDGNRYNKGGDINIL